MALVEMRVCDVTGEPDAETGWITIEHPLVGKLRWKLDMARGGVKTLEEALGPITEKAELELATAPSMNGASGHGKKVDDDEEDSPAEPGPSAPAAHGDGPPDIPELTPEEKTAARVWGQRAVNWKRCGLKDQPALRGRVPLAILLGWVEAGRPMPA